MSQLDISIAYQSLIDTIACFYIFLHLILIIIYKIRFIENLKKFIT